MSSRFRIVEHVAPSQHIREYPAATSNGDEDAPVLAVKQYIPLSNTAPKSGNVTIIAAHANGFPKELYEPLWDELDRRCQEQQLRIRSIWIADVWNQGYSGVLNEEILGDDPNWFDHSRDLLYLINQHQGSMPQPLVGIGHSMGGTQLAYLSLMHPRLFQSLVLIDPVIQQQNPGAIFAAASTRRRDVWPSRTAVAEGFKKSKFYQTWDARVLDLLVEHGLRDVPTALIPAPEKKAENTPVTLTTTKHQELFMFERPTYRGQPGVAPQDDKLHYADFNPSAPADYSGHPFYRPEAAYVFNHLPEIRPNVLWLFGEKSDVGKSKTSTAADGWAEKVSRTGVAVGGGGGVKHGQVEQAVVRDAGHLLAFEKVGDSAEVISEYLGRQTRQWKQRSDAFEKERMQKSQLEKSTIDQRWLDNVDLNGSFPNSKTKGGKSKI